MDECKLTFEQVQLLVNGQKIQVSYSTPEECGRVRQHEIELIPLEKDDDMVLRVVDQDDVCGKILVPKESRLLGDHVLIPIDEWERLNN